MGMQPTSAPSFSIAPNPSRGQLRVSFDYNLDARSIAILNAQGKEVYSVSPSQIGTEREFTMHLPQALASGVYIFRVYQKGGPALHKKLILVD